MKGSSQTSATRCRSSEYRQPLARRHLIRVITATACVAISLVLAGCTGGQHQSAPTSPDGSPSSTAPPTGQLPLDESAHPTGPYVPWHLIRVDRTNDRIYFSAHSDDTCVRPSRAHIQQGPHDVVLTIEGTRGKEPCTAQAVTFVGYVPVTPPLGDKTVEHGP